MSEPAWVSYSQIYVESAEDYSSMEDCFAGQQNGLCGAASAGKLFLITGLHSGQVDFTVELHDEEPPLDDSWEDVVEASYRPSGPAMLICWPGDNAAWDLDLQQIDYRVRYCAWGMDPRAPRRPTRRRTTDRPVPAAVLAGCAKAGPDRQAHQHVGRVLTRSHPNRTPTSNGRATRQIRRRSRTSEGREHRDLAP
ncbi:hypothetical protein GCM10009804_75310 [Kribbella hippodromi]|uniref:Uncharacterized protein n=2 Tax=Kribbella hippodromi TaxID=434347 RepID=A0ABP4QEA8_9ACTN